MAGRDVEKHQLVGSLVVITRGHFDRVAGVFEVDEIGPLDHAAVVDVEARDDPLGQHAQSQPRVPAAAMRAGTTFDAPSRGIHPVYDGYRLLFYKRRKSDPRGFKTGLFAWS